MACRFRRLNRRSTSLSGNSVSLPEKDLSMSSHYNMSDASPKIKAFDNLLPTDAPSLLLVNSYRTVMFLKTYRKDMRAIILGDKVEIAY